MKINIPPLCLLILLFIVACQNTEQEIDLNDGVTILLPETFQIEEKHTTEIDILKAQFQSQNIICSYVPINGIDTINSEQVTSILILNTERYIEPFDGREISITNKTIENNEAIEFRFQYDRNDATYQVYGNSLIYSGYIYFLTYEAPYPLKPSIENSIVRFFKSVQLD